MDCSDFNQMLDNYANINENDKLLMNAHAENCENCRRELEFYNSIMKTAASLPVMEPPEDLLDKINSRIDNMPKRTVMFDKAVNNFRAYRMQYAAAAACLAVGLIVGLNSGAIQDKLNPPDADGVISTSTKVSDTDKDNRLGDYELDQSHDEEHKKPEQEEKVVAEKKNDEPTQKPALKSTPAAVATARPSSARTASGSVASSAVTAPEKRASASQPVSGTATVQTRRTATAKSAAPVTNTVSSVTSAPQITSAPVITAAPIITDAPAAPSESGEQGSKSRYTIARGNYYIPEVAEANIEVTEEPAAIETDITGERYQIAMGSYEISEDEKKALAQNKLIVNESDITKIIECMNSSWIKGTTEGYTATAAAFNNFLAKLDAEGIYYNYIKLSESEDEVYFVLLAN